MSRRGYIKSPDCLSRWNYIESLVSLSRLGRNKRIIRRPNKSGDIYLSLFLTYIVFVKRTITLVFHIFICKTIIRHNIGVTPRIWSAHWRHIYWLLTIPHCSTDARKPPVVRFTSTRGRFSIYTGLQCPQATPHPRRFTIPAGDSLSAPVYNSRGRLSRPRRLTTPRPTHLVVPSLKLRPSLSSVSRSLVYINIPGRTCLHELFIGRTSRRHYSFD